MKTYKRGDDFQEFINSGSELVRRKGNCQESWDILYEMQKAYALYNNCPCFCNPMTSTYHNYKVLQSEPIGKYIMNNRSVENAIDYFTTQLITGCPASGNTWCD